MEQKYSGTVYGRPANERGAASGREQKRKGSRRFVGAFVAAAAVAAAVTVPQFIGGKKEIEPRDNGITVDGGKDFEPQVVRIVKRGEVPAANETTQAAEALALPYTSCEVTSQQDLHQKPGKNEQTKNKDTSGDRTTIRIQAKVQYTDAAQELYKKYEHSPAVGWRGPAGVGFIIDSDPTAPDPNLIQVTDDNVGGSDVKEGILNTTLYPSNEWEATNGYGEPGRKMTVYIENKTRARDANNQNFEMIGHTPCAAFELHMIEGGYEWQQVSLPNQIVASINTKAD